MNILVTGSSGFVGAHLLELFAKEGHTASGIGHQAEPHKSNLPYYQIDMLDADSVNSLDLTPFDAVVHLAGLAAVGPSFEQPRRYIDANAGMQINLFEAILKQKASPRVLIISTGGVYKADQLPITETSAVATPNPYAVSKMAQEHLGDYYSRRNLEVIVARPFNHIGPGQAEGFIVADLAKQVAQAEHTGSGTIQVGNLSSCRDYTDVRDIVRAYLLLLEKGAPGELYNVCSGVSHSGEEVLAGLLKHSQCQITVETDADRMRPSDIPDIYGSHAKLTADTGWQPIIPLEQTLGDVLDHWRQA